VSDLAIIRIDLVPDEKIWLGADVEFEAGGWSSGQVVALAPKPGHVWVCDGHTFTQVSTEQLRRGWEQDSLL
jgi:hypothetical protein